MLRTRFLAVVAACAVGASAAYATGVEAPNQDLPELGSVANAAVTLDEEYGAGLMIVRSLRESGQLLEDPEISQYIQEIGHSISSHAEEGQHQFNYFVIRDPVVNAFAVWGGFIFVNSGLILMTSNENELAGVLAHETAHVTQRHLVRGLIDQSHAGLLSTAAMLAAVLLGATAGRNSPSGVEGAILGAQGAAIQHQINFTRSQEFEADRVGISTMASAGYDPLGMASMFESLNRNMPDPTRMQAIEFLIDHPSSSQRVAEARARAAQIGRIRHEDSLSYTLMRERLRSLVGDPQAVHEYYVNLFKNGGGNDLADRYGNDVANVQRGHAAEAIPDLESLVRDYPKVTQFYGELGQAYAAAGRMPDSIRVLKQSLDLFPRNVPLTIHLADTLMQSGDNKQAHEVLLDLFNIVEPTPDQTRLIAKAANAAGDVADSYYYMAQFYIMTGDLKMCFNQLQLALQLPGLNAIQRARFSAQLDEVRAALAKQKKAQQVADDGDGRH